TNSKDPLTKRLAYKIGDAHSSSTSLQPSLLAGIERVKRGGFALVTESLRAEEAINNSCDLQTLGQAFGTREYGIAFPKRSPYLPIFSEVLNRLNKSGRLQEMKDKYYHKNLDLDC